MFTSNTILIILIFTILLWLLPQFTLLAILFFTVAGLCQQNIFRKWGQLLADKKFKLVYYNKKTKTGAVLQFPFSFKDQDTKTSFYSFILLKRTIERF